MSACGGVMGSSDGDSPPAASLRTPSPSRLDRLAFMSEMTSKSPKAPCRGVRSVPMEHAEEEEVSSDNDVTFLVGTDLPTSPSMRD